MRFLTFTVPAAIFTATPPENFYEKRDLDRIDSTVTLFGTTEPRRQDRAHGNADPAWRSARQPLKERPVGERNIASQPDAASGLVAGVKNPRAVQQVERRHDRKGHSTEK